MMGRAGRKQEAGKRGARAAWLREKKQSELRARYGHAVVKEIDGWVYVATGDGWSEGQQVYRRVRPVGGPEACRA